MQRFTAAQRQLREEWYDLVETADHWRELGRMKGLRGESDPTRVENSTTGVVGVAKPGPSKAAQEQHCRAAHEKLAFDLAYMLNLPVPPVVLWPLGAPETYKRGRSISAWAFDQSLTWKEAEDRAIVTPLQRENARPIVSAMRAFHLWIGDLDRDTQQMRLNLVEEVGETCPIAFFDHSCSMSWWWCSDDHPTPTQPTYFPLFDLRDAMMETADLIAGLSDSQIKHVVDRIPELYLPDPQRGHILSNLLLRRGRLRDIVDRSLRGSTRR